MIAEIARQLDALAKRYPDMTLDRSFASLDAVEDAFLAGLAKGERGAGPEIAAYMGATVIEHVDGAAWAKAKDVDYPVVRLPGMHPGVVYDPRDATGKVRRSQIRCLLRDDAERFDLSIGRAKVAALGRLAKGGKPADLDKLGASLPASAKKPTAACREVIQAGVELVARVAAAARPKATWSVSDNDVDIDERGEILLGGAWDVWRSVRWVMLGTKPPTHLSEILDDL
ncbi:MAG: hypothetical protein K8W52_08350 [Deltaproteobacteria bacterium]|nr:hypothetical protein [Deltaproteobacteria bacterium]